MRLAEALVLRADYQKKIHELKLRIQNNVKVQEGEVMAEDPLELLKAIDEVCMQLEVLIKRINKTNGAVAFNEEMTLAEAIATRDMIKTKRNIYTAVIEQATIKYDRYTRSEVKFVSTVNIADLQKEVDQLAKAFREIDMRIQEKNWTTDLI